MNEDILKGKWMQMKGTVQSKWGKLTDTDLTEIQGDAEKNDVQGRRYDQHNHQASIPPDLVQLFDEKRPDSQVYNSFQHKSPKQPPASASSPSMPDRRKTLKAMLMR